MKPNLLFFSRNNNFIIAFCRTWPSAEGRWLLFLLMQMGSWSTLPWKPHSHLRVGLLKGLIPPITAGWSGWALCTSSSSLHPSISQQPLVPLFQPPAKAASSQGESAVDELQNGNSCHWRMWRCTSSVVFCCSRSIFQTNRLKVCNQGRNKDYGRKTTSHSTWNLGIWPSSWPNWGPVYYITVFYLLL